MMNITTTKISKKELIHALSLFLFWQNGLSVPVAMVVSQGRGVCYIWLNLLDLLRLWILIVGFTIEALLDIT